MPEQAQISLLYERNSKMPYSHKTTACISFYNICCSKRTFFACLPPGEYGWDLVNGQLQPVLTCQPPAPDNLLNLISCNCKAGCEQGCGCRKAGIQCLLLCGHCRGSGCNNYTKPEADEEADYGLTRECPSEETSELGWSTSGNYAEDGTYVQETTLACSDIHSEEPIA